MSCKIYASGVLQQIENKFKRRHSLSSYRCTKTNNASVTASIINTLWLIFLYHNYVNLNINILTSLLIKECRKLYFVAIATF